jgi:hypothetical protein
MTLPNSVAALITAQRLERVPADLPSALARLSRAEDKLAAARKIATIDVEIAYVTAYDATRIAVTAHMLSIGYRARAVPRAHEPVGTYAEAMISTPAPTSTNGCAGDATSRSTTTLLSVKPTSSLTSATRKPSSPPFATTSDRRSNPADQTPRVCLTQLLTTAARFGVAALIGDSACSADSRSPSWSRGLGKATPGPVITRGDDRPELSAHRQGSEHCLQSPKSAIRHGPPSRPTDISGSLRPLQRPANDRHLAHLRDHFMTENNQPWPTF